MSHNNKELALAKSTEIPNWDCSSQLCSHIILTECQKIMDLFKELRNQELSITDFYNELLSQLHKQKKSSLIGLFYFYPKHKSGSFRRLKTETVESFLSYNQIQLPVSSYIIQEANVTVSYDSASKFVISLVLHLFISPGKVSKQTASIEVTRFDRGVNPSRPRGQGSFGYKIATTGLFGDFIQEI